MNPSSFSVGNVAAHYAHQDLEAAVLAALTAAGKDLDRLKPEDLAPIDEFHILGRKATENLARNIRFEETMQVLDVGSGLGGASRYLALEFGCRVTGLDLSEEYCRVATMLAKRFGLDGRVSYRQGNALQMPFADATFDVLWTQHAAMNIADKEGLYREMWRVLKPGGMLAIYDILAGAGGPVRFPVPWAREPSISFLVATLPLLETLEAVGFTILKWRDATEEGLAWFQRMDRRIFKEDLPPLGLQVLLGPDFPLMVKNQVQNLEENRIVLIEAVAHRPLIAHPEGG